MNIKEIQERNFRWFSVLHPGESEVGYLRDTFAFLHEDLDDCLTPSQRLKLERRPDYLFLALLFPYFNREKKIIEPFEIDIFLMRDTIITVQDHRGPIVDRLITTLEIDDAMRHRLLGDGPIRLLESLLHDLLSATYPMIDHISLDVQDIERRLFAGNERAFLEELLLVRRNIAVFRKTMQAHKFILRKLLNMLTGQNGFLHLGAQASAFENLIELTKEIWDAIDIQKEEVETLAVTNETLISHRLNEIMKKYTTLSVMIFAMTLIAALLTIRLHGTPLIDVHNGFWFVVIIELLLAGFLYLIFKRKRLL